jgi:hypothetical protein
MRTRRVSQHGAARPPDLTARALLPLPPLLPARIMSDGVDIKTLTAAQLQVLGEQLEEELGTLSDSFGKLQQAVSRFYQSGIALEAFAAEKEGAWRRPRVRVWLQCARGRETGGAAGNAFVRVARAKNALRRQARL